MHTTRHSPDSVMDPLELVRRARDIGLDGVVITEHDWLWTADELDELRAAEPGLVVLAGIEVTTKQGHVLDRFQVTELDGSPLSGARQLTVQTAVLAALRDDG